MTSDPGDERIYLTRLSKDSEPADIIIQSEIFLDIFQTYKIQTRSTCIIKNDAGL